MGIEGMMKKETESTTAFAIRGQVSPAVVAMAQLVREGKIEAARDYVMKAMAEEMPKYAVGKGRTQELDQGSFYNVFGIAMFYTAMTGEEIPGVREIADSIIERPPTIGGKFAQDVMKEIYK